MVKKTIENTYQKLTQREHVLSRSGMYIGSIKKQMEELWVAKETEDSIPKMEKIMVEYSPGFMKIFDEVLTNATDHSFRDSSVTTIKVEYSQETGEISVWNNGSGIPIQLHKEHNMFVPELIFGHLLSGSNYDDTTTRTGAGTNGLGSKLSNIYSKKFIVETLDSDEKKKFVQEFSNNMTERTKAKITNNSGKSYTKITFIPDYSRFDMTGLEDDTVLLIRKRVLDCIACTNSTVQIYLNGEKLKGKGLVDYTKYFFEGEKVITESHTERIKNKNGEVTEYNWEYAIVPYSQYEQVSFVNGNSTNQGGKHVDYIMYQIINKLKKMLEEKKKLKELKPNFIKDKMFLFLRATVANPTFNSQTKEQLTTQSKDFGCTITVSDQFITKLYKSSITEEIVEFCKLKESASLSKHSVSGDTPLLLKDKNNKIIIKTIEKITSIFTETYNNNDYGKSDYKVWTEEGWTDIIHVMRHKSSKQMYRVLTHTGFVDVTEDHSLLTLKNEEISPKNCIEGDELLHSFPEFTDNKLKLNFNYKEMKSIELHNYASYLKIPYYRGTKDRLISLIENKHIEYENQHFIELEYDNTINYDEAWVMGLFWADGTAGIYTDKRGYTIYNFAIHNTNKEFLIKSQEIFSKIYPNEKTSIYILERDSTRQTKYQLQFNGYSKIEYIIKKYINLFYYQTNTSITDKGTKTKYGNKYVPIEILNAPKNIRSNFLNGVYCGDGRGHDINVQSIKEMSIESKISAQGIYYLATSLGYFVSIQCRQDKPNIFCLIFGKQYYNRNPNKIKKIIKLGYTNEYVYDLETRNHHFQAGIGRMIVHNTDGKKTSKIYIPKLEDALWAGTNKSNQCTLILTEGDSAKTFAMWGRSVVGPEKYGVMSLKGKFLNLRDASITQLIGNEEINNLKQILGLKQDKVYKDVSELRYGKVMLLTDADCDGSHIKSLLVNFFHYWWPNLLKINPNFLQTLKTPIVKAIKGKKVIEFFTEQDYLKWKETGINLNSYQIRYFKGLGTSKKEDAKDTFKRLEELTVDYYYKDKGCDESILLAFEKDKNIKAPKKNTSDDASDVSETTLVKCSDKRKKWLSNYDKGIYIDSNQKRVSYQDLINKELIHFSIYDNLRSIPSLCDGLKTSQRKILYYMLKKNKKDLIKVAQLSGYVSAETSYHHGEASLQGAIINLAQNFVGSNNINLLYPDGNFGSRLQCGKDAASPRYIFTRLSDATDIIFNPNDTPLLEFLNDDGTQIEPEWYLPIIPIVLVNGCEGIGTGYSTYIPSFNPKDIIVHLIKMIDDENYTPSQLKPYFKGFNGQVEEIDKGSYVTRGKWEKLSDKQIKITEIPVGMGVTIYKEFLESLIENNQSKKVNDKTSKAKKKKFALKDVQNKTKDENDDICFIVEFKNESDLDDLIKSGTLEKELKLVKSFSTNNMYLFNESLILTKYDTPVDILLDFFDIRIQYYIKRRDYIIKKLKRELLILEAKARFIKEYIDGKLDINKKSKDYIIALLEKRNYPTHETSYDYLLRLPIYSLTLEKINELNEQCEKKKNELLFIKSKTSEELWKIDLQELLKKLT
jgi:DNA gyrase/topoisomerase IV subunit B